MERALAALGPACLFCVVKVSGQFFPFVECVWRSAQPKRERREKKRGKGQSSDEPSEILAALARSGHRDVKKIIDTWIRENVRWMQGTR